MHLGNLSPTPTKKSRRVGRGNGSGVGTTCGRGNKGQKSRSGGGVPHWFEGGQMPLYRRLPQRGFNNARFKKQYQIVNLQALNKFSEGTEIDSTLLVENNLIEKANKPLKILAFGEIEKALKIKANKFSKAAIDKIKAKGGEAIIV